MGVHFPPHLYGPEAPSPLARMCSDPWSPIPTLRTATLRVEYRAEDRVALPPSVAGVWRGLLGAALHEGGPGGLYRDLFETPLDAAPSRLPARLRGRLGLNGSHAPHPFVLRVPEGPRDLGPGDPAAVEVVLIERAVRALPALAAAFDGLGARGVGGAAPQADGHRRGRLRLTGAALRVGRARLDLHDGRSWALPDPCDEGLVDRLDDLFPAASDDAPRPSPSGAPLGAEFASPLRLRVGGADAGPVDLTAPVLARAVFRRLASLAACYAPEPPDPGALEHAEARLQDLAARTGLDGRRLRPLDRARYSHRQGRPVPAGGVVGPFRLSADPDDLAAWGPLLRRAEAVHLGKGTSQGQGWLRLPAPTA